MTAPLRKPQEQEEGRPLTEMGENSWPTSASEIEAEEAGPRLVQSEPENMATAGALAQSTVELDATPLFPTQEQRDLQDRWERIQTEFVDDPRDAVREADALVSTAIQRLAEVFMAERSKLEQQWDKGESVTTEGLRVALQRYRSFFRRVLSV
jgi:hypothetical protein